MLFENCEEGEFDDPIYIHILHICIVKKEQDSGLKMGRYQKSHGEAHDDYKRAHEIHSKSLS